MEPFFEWNRLQRPSLLIFSSDDSIPQILLSQRVSLSLFRFIQVYWSLHFFIGLLSFFHPPDYSISKSSCCRLPAFTGKHCQLFKIQHFSAFDDAYDRFLRSIAFPLWSMAVTDSRLCAFRYSNPLSTMQSHFFCSCMIW